MVFVKVQFIWKILGVLIASHSICECSYDIPEPKVEILIPRGLRVSIPDAAGLSLFVFHGAINRSLEGMQVGDFYGEITKPINGRWIYETMDVTLNAGDVLNFWAHLKHDDYLYRLLGRSITVPHIFYPKNTDIENSVAKDTKSNVECIKSTSRRPPIQADRLKVTVCVSTSSP